ncbi:phage portal protein [Paracoccus versutus]|uniref:HK97 family phage portal protein n=1 Tax=Paracoccus versutus TaxID=34007 RepID=A0A3D9XJZ1_PARVE|nr:phage portal protein [Paracoccus versutus]REF69948.1 HK97 family phage portal protein [Paracoccus versutus]WGR57706.1 phage portal protein [Paracoccus versutus]
MGLFTRALAAPFKLYHSVAEEVAKDRRLRLSDGSGWSQLFGRSSYAGKTVTMTSAMQLSAVWACIRVTAQAISALPLGVYERRGDDDRVRVDDDPVADVLTGSPNADQTPLEFWEGMVAWLVTSGNAYAEKGLIGSRLTSLEPLQAGGLNCRPVRLPDGRLVYRVTDRGKTEDLPRDKVLHLKGFGQSISDRDIGLSPIAVGANTMGAAMAAQEASSSVFANGMMPSGFILFDQQLTKDQRAQARKNLIEPLQGSGKTGAIGILEGGTQFLQTQMNPEDVQMLDTRRFDIEEICRWWGVPPIVIGHAGQGQTMWGSGVEQILISWLVLGINPICSRIEARVAKQLLRPHSSPRRYAEFNREALLQMDSTAKANFISRMVQSAIMTPGEGRAKLNLPRKDGTDRLLAQTSLAPLETLGQDKPTGQLRQALLNFLGITEKDKGDEHS